MYSTLKVVHKALILVLVPVILPLFALAILITATVNSLQGLEQIDHQQQVLLTLNRIGSTVARATTFAMSHKYDTEEFRKSMIELQTLNLNEADQKFPELKDFVSQVSMMRGSVTRLVEAKDTINEDTNRLDKKARKTSRQALLVALIEFSNLTKGLIDFDKSLAGINDVQSSLFTNIGFSLFAVIVCGGISFFVFHVFTSDFLKRLNVVSENSRRIATGAPLLEPIEGYDELADLDYLMHQVEANLSDARRQELSILDNAVDVICWLNDKLKFNGANPASSSLWRYGPDELNGMPLVSLVTEPSADELHIEFQKIREREGEGKFDTVIKRKDGSLRDFHWNVKWSKEDQHFSCVVHDITEMKAVERLKHQFMLMVSHDLRSPLTALTMNISMYLDGVKEPLTEKQVAELQRAQTSMQRLMALINDLLELSKLESGALAVERQRVRAFNVCSEAVESLEAMATLAKVKIERPKNDGVMFGEERRLLQATINLLSNSIKFAPAKSTIKVEINDKDSFIEIRITDVGPGIPASDRGIIFDRFRQSQSQSNVPIKGSGLGLAIVKAIVVAHGGTIGVDSEVGKGSSFWFQIPKFLGANEDEDLE